MDALSLWWWEGRRVKFGHQRVISLDHQSEYRRMNTPQKKWKIMVYWAPTVCQALKNFPLTFSEFSCLRAWAVISIYTWGNVMLGEVKYRPNVIQLRMGSTGMPGSEPKFLTCTIFCKKSRGLRLTCAGILSQGRGRGGKTSEVPREVRWRPGRVCWRHRDVRRRTRVPHTGATTQWMNTRSLCLLLMKTFGNTRDCFIIFALSCLSYLEWIESQIPECNHFTINKQKKTPTRVYSTWSCPWRRGWLGGVIRLDWSIHHGSWNTQSYIY